MTAKDLTSDHHRCPVPWSRLQTFNAELRWGGVGGEALAAVLAAVLAAADEIQHHDQ